MLSSDNSIVYEFLNGKTDTVHVPNNASQDSIEVIIKKHITEKQGIADEELFLRVVEEEPLKYLIIIESVFVQFNDFIIENELEKKTKPTDVYLCFFDLLQKFIKEKQIQNLD